MQTVVVTGPQAEVDAAKAIIKEIVDNDSQAGGSGAGLRR